MHAAGEAQGSRAQRVFVNGVRTPSATNVVGGAMKLEVLVSIAGLSGLLLGFNFTKQRKTDMPDQKSTPDRFHGLDSDSSLRLSRRVGSSCTPSPIGQDHSRIISAWMSTGQQSRTMFCVVADDTDAASAPTGPSRRPWRTCKRSPSRSEPKHAKPS